MGMIDLGDSLTEMERRIADRAFTNMVKLANCDRHELELSKHKPDAAESYGQSEIIDCTKCGGRLNGVMASMYVTGYKAAGGDMRDVASNPLLKNLGL